MAAHHGEITLDDLRDYKAIERKPLEGTYKGYGVITAPPPSSGGVGILQMMGMLETTGYEKSGAGSALSLHYEAEAMRRYFADRSEFLGDPDFVKVPLAALLNPAYIASRRATIDPAKATPSDTTPPRHARRLRKHRNHPLLHRRRRRQRRLRHLHPQRRLRLRRHRHRPRLPAQQ